MTTTSIDIDRLLAATLGEDVGVIVGADGAG